MVYHCAELGRGGFCQGAGLFDNIFQTQEEIFSPYFLFDPLHSALASPCALRD